MINNFSPGSFGEFIMCDTATNPRYLEGKIRTEDHKLFKNSETLFYQKINSKQEIDIMISTKKQIIQIIHLYKTQT
ncbi:hypothetical protein V1477_017868 [Vespula maculifrons]|uniref:Uncharacterized protein n=1 Tax=Vespula maculifrons TaxID=7453 RepID=A0ABD2AZL9_VESMC